MRNTVIENNFSGVPLALCLTLGLVLLVPAFANAQAFVQVADNGGSPKQASSVNVTFKNAQAAGNLNVVVAGWSDTTSSVTGVTDTLGNTYFMAAGTNAGPGISQAIYYASNIAAGTNTITVTFRTDAPAASPDVRAIEYSGVSTITPLNISAGAAGSSSSANSGPATTTVTALIVAGGWRPRLMNQSSGSQTLRLKTRPNERQYRRRNRHSCGWRCSSHRHTQRLRGVGLQFAAFGNTPQHFRLQRSSLILYPQLRDLTPEGLL